MKTLLNIIDNAVTTLLKAVGFDFEGSVGDVIGRFFSGIVDKITKVFDDTIKGILSFIESAIRALPFGDTIADKLFKNPDEQAISGQADEEEESGIRAFDLSTAFFGEKARKKLSRMRALEGMHERLSGEEEELKSLRIEIDRLKKESSKVGDTVAIDGSTKALHQQASVINASALAMTNDPMGEVLRAAR